MSLYSVQSYSLFGGSFASLRVFLDRLRTKSASGREKSPLSKIGIPLPKGTDKHNTSSNPNQKG